MADGGHVLTYAELDALSNRVARALLAQGVAPGDRVGILARKSAVSVVALDEAGDFIFLGRTDGMVKTRGYRVELGEVEAALYACPAVREAVVLPVPDGLLGSPAARGHQRRGRPDQGRGP